MFGLEASALAVIQVLISLVVRRGVLYHSPETTVETNLEDSITNVWPKVQKIQRIKLEATCKFGEVPHTHMHHHF